MSNNVTYVRVENNVIEVNYADTSFNIIVAESPLNDIDSVINYLKNEDILVTKDNIYFS